MAGEGDGELECLRRELAETKLNLAKAEAEVAAASGPSIKAGPPLLGDNEDDDSDPFAVTFHSIVIFGADGNLAMMKTFPALFSLMRHRHIPEDVAIIGYARDSMSDDEFQKKVYRAIYTVKHPQSDRQRFLSRISYRHGQFNDPSAYENLCRALQEQERAQEDAWLAKHGFSGSSTGSTSSTWSSTSGGTSGNRGAGGGPGTAAATAAAAAAFPPPPLARTFKHVRTFYLAVPPFLYPDIARCCAAAGLRREALSAREEKQDRFILEKPFGKDTASCAKLCSAVGEALSESQMYRIDHYLGKELVMNVLVMRFANISFNAIWDRQSISSVQILCKETVGTAGRGGYFDSYGIIRDVMQNHLLQILALVGMEQPLSLSAEHIRQEKVKLLQAVAPLTMKDVLVGQFAASGPGEVGPGSKAQPGYLDDPTIEDKASTTETFAVAVLHINNPRWAGVPFILKAGKALDESKVEVRIRFRGVPGALETFGSCSPNELVIRVQPDERIYWKITSKVPGLDFNVETRRMDLLYAHHGYGSGGNRGSSTGGGECSGAGSQGTSMGGGGGGGAAGASRPMYAAATAAAVAAATGTAPPPVVGGSGFGYSDKGEGGGGSGKEELPGAYERLILEVLRGDQTNFVHADELLASWRIFTPALHDLKASQVVPEPYLHGSRGPAEAEERFAKRFGFADGFPEASAPRHQSIAWGVQTPTKSKQRGAATHDQTRSSGGCSGGGGSQGSGPQTMVTKTGGGIVAPAKNLPSGAQSAPSLDSR
eukprot:CAMPEP_0171918432 /NCGR_PEP_ID=MMETSP0993-20121228/17151_1 /TAXON_ID=483369 /ORGANISM="non described non described, Strain CCMP2098" /LENGTH=768 /DNA_ID=CAMNT_0012554755 /DNA_START=21 /DNA_END=2327 /DNA_ORIENTATION=+